MAAGAAVEEHLIGPDAWLGTSEMASRIRAFDWSATPLGPLPVWSSSLRSAVSLCLHSRFQMAIYWGSQLTCLYNDAESDVLGNLHPAALGMPARTLLHESWDVVGPKLETVMESGEATLSEDELLVFDRYGAPEAGFFTYSYSPIVDPDGRTGGVLLVSHETTGRVLSGHREDSALRLTAATAGADTEREACVRAAQALDGRPLLPLTLIYLCAENEESAICVAAGGAARPVGRVSFAAAAALPRGGSVLLGAAGLLEPGGDPVCRSALATAMRRRDGTVFGFTVIGLADGLGTTGPYRSFIESVGAEIERGVLASRAREAEVRHLRAVAELDAAKSTLFSNFSHELRSPLMLILGHVERILAGELSDALRSSVSVVRRNAERILKLADTLLDLSGVPTRRQTRMFRATGLGALTTDLASMFDSAAREAGLALNVDCPSLGEPIYVDREAWEQILVNLLSNALKFTPSGEISVGLHLEGAEAVLRLEDTGIGIPSRDLERVFERFHRSAPAGAGTRASDGYGIGLALVRELVELHAGTIEAGLRPGGGTRMVVRIPRGRDHLAEDAIEGGDPNEPTQTVPGQAERPVEEQGDRARVLVVDDSPDMLGYLSGALSAHHDVEAAGDGDEALRAAIREPPDVVISDVMMPGRDGFSFATALRSDPRTREIPVVLLTARADPASRLRGMAIGVDDFLIKPFAVTELVALVRSKVEVSRARRQAAEARGRFDERTRSEADLRRMLGALRAAQVRVAEAGDAERQRIERNLHDGAQQKLVAMQLRLSVLGDEIEAEPAIARRELDRLAGELESALDEIRELAHGLYPPLLASDGLGPALAAAGRHAGLPASVEVEDFPRLPMSVESAVYFCCIEALQNAAKHAGPNATAAVRVGVRAGGLEFRVADDGAGFDPERVERGVGLVNLRDRLAALGGDVEVTSAPGAGVVATGWVPLA